MGVFDGIKAFVHSITTDDHYASYDKLNSRDSGHNTANNVIGSHYGHGSTSRLNELNNGSSHSLIDRVATPVGYTPGMRSSSNLNSTSDLPLQNLSRDGLPPLPSIDSLWDRIEKWMDDEYPELEDNLNDGVTTADLNEFENDLAIGKLPLEFRQFYKRHDGQLRGGKPTGIIMGLALLDLESIFEEYSVWSKVAQRLEKTNNTHLNHFPKEGSSKSAASNNTFIANQRSIPPNSIQPYYYYRGWIPILKDHIGNQIALDLAPGPNGTWGQVIIFGRDFDTKLVIASSFQEFIWMFVQDLENGNYSIDSDQFNEDLGYLGNSRNDDYMIGDEDEDQGELSYYDHDGKEFGGALKGRLSYLEILKKRALKAHGLTENYSTAFTPPRISIKKDAAASSKDSTLLNVEVALPKETLIDDKVDSKSKEKAPVAKASSEVEVKEEPKKEPKKPETKEATNEATKEATKEDSKEDADTAKEAPKEETKPDTKVEPVEEPETEETNLLADQVQDVDLNEVKESTKENLKEIDL